MFTGPGMPQSSGCNARVDINTFSYHLIACLPVRDCFTKSEQVSCIIAAVLLSVCISVQETWLMFKLRVC